MVYSFKGTSPKVDKTCYLAPSCSVIGDVTIGRNTSVWHNAVIRGDMASISIGENSNIQDCCVLHCITGKEINIGNNVTVGHGAILHSCAVEDGTLVGMGAIILDGAHIGKNCLIGAGTLVTSYSDIPDGSLVVGSPGAVKRKLAEEEIAHVQSGAEEYLKLAAQYLDKSG